MGFHSDQAASARLWIGVVCAFMAGCHLTDSLSGYADGKDASVDGSAAGQGGAGAAGAGNGGVGGTSGVAGAGGGDVGGTAGSSGGSAGETGGRAGAGGTAGSGGGTAGSGGGTCDLHVSGQACDTCIRKYCMKECVACSDSQACIDAYQCVAACPTKDYTDSCVTACAQQNFAGLQAMLDLAGPNGCGEQFCDEACHDNRSKGPSCKGLANKCGANHDQPCCVNAFVVGGTFSMGRSTNGEDSCVLGKDKCPDREQPEHDVHVSDFRMDVFEVTVGRFRRFVDAYPSSKPNAGDAAHWGQAGSGWRAEWDSLLPADKTVLLKKIDGCADHTWTDKAGGNEYLPINCVSWYEAFAFCAWDGSALPSEAQWEYAAAGGTENRRYPWGSMEPHTTLAMFGCADRDGGACSLSDIGTVGSFPGGAGKWGQVDLAGSMWEWVVDWRRDDWYANDGLTCSDCINVDKPSNDKVRGLRGGSWTNSLHDPVLPFRAAVRNGKVPSVRQRNSGFRCVRWP